MSKLKMRELSIFKNRTELNDKGGIVMLHQDDMTPYNSWMLTEYHGVDKVVFRGELNKIPSDIVEKYKINNDTLNKIGNPENVIITYSEQDTY